MIPLLADKNATRRDLTEFFERQCANARINYQPLEWEGDLLVGKFTVPRYPRDFWPAFLCATFRRSDAINCTRILTTGFQHKIWPFPAITHDLELSGNRGNQWQEDEVEAFFERLRVVHVVFMERNRRLSAPMSDTDFHNILMTVYRSGKWSKQVRINFLTPLPALGENLTGTEVIGLLMQKCMGMHPYFRAHLFGWIIDHYILKIDPLHNNGRRVIFRLGGLE